MESTRQLKVGKQIQKDLGEIIQMRSMAAFGGALVTVSEVRISPDLASASVYLSIFPTEKGKEVMKIFEAENKSIRGELGKRVRHQLRIVPELRFFIDETLDRLGRIDELLKK